MRLQLLGWRRGSVDGIGPKGMVVEIGEWLMLRAVYLFFFLFDGDETSAFQVFFSFCCSLFMFVGHSDLKYVFVVLYDSVSVDQIWADFLKENSWVKSCIFRYLLDRVFGSHFLKQNEIIF